MAKTEFSEGSMSRTALQKVWQVLQDEGVEFTEEEVRGAPTYESFAERLVVGEDDGKGGPRSTFIRPARIKEPGKLFGKVIELSNKRTFLRDGEGGELEVVTDYPGGRVRLYFDNDENLAGVEGESDDRDY